MVRIKGLSKNKRTSILIKDCTTYQKFKKEEYEKLVNDLFIQSDGRYSQTYVDDLVYFLKNRAIIIETKDVPSVKEEIQKDSINIEGPQKPQKLLTLSIFEKLGIKLIGFERKIAYGRVDVLGEKDNKKIYVECGSCRVDKGFNYLREDNAELWLVDSWLGFNSERTIAELHIIKRGPNWEDCIRKYDNFLRQELKKIKSPLDNI